MAFLDRVLGKDNNETKLRQEINSLELRKSTVFATIDGEIGRLQNEKNNVLLSAGVAAYEAWTQKEAQADLLNFWNQIVELDKLIKEQEDKKIEMGNRYNEEIKLISGNLSISTENSILFKTCPKCNSQVGINDAFCQICGTKVQ